MLVKEKIIVELQDRLHELHEKPEKLNRLLFFPSLPNLENLKQDPNPTDVEIAYLTYLIADKIITHDLSYSSNWPEDYLNEMDRVVELGGFLRQQEKIPAGDIDYK